MLSAAPCWHMLFPVVLGRKAASSEGRVFNICGRALCFDAKIRSLCSKIQNRLNIYCLVPYVSYNEIKMDTRFIFFKPQVAVTEFLNYYKMFSRDPNSSASPDSKPYLLLTRKDAIRHHTTGAVWSIERKQGMRVRVQSGTRGLIAAKHHCDKVDTFKI